MNSLLKVLLLSTQKTAISQLNKSTNNILFANRRNKNNEKLKRHLINFMSILLFLFLFLHNAACIANEPPPGNSGGLPSGIFCLDGMRWEHIEDQWFKWRQGENIYNTEGELIKVINYWNGDGSCKFASITYSVRQISENIAELYCSEKQTWRAKIIDKINDTTYFLDTTIITSSKLYGEFTIEGKKVYYDKILLYDFSLNVGDTFLVGSGNGLDYNGAFFDLVSIDSVIVGNEYKKKYNFKMKEGHPYGSGSWDEYSVIEVIGCTDYLFHTMHSPFLVDFNLPVLQRVYYKEQLIWGK